MQIDIHAKVLGHDALPVELPPTTPAVADATETPADAKKPEDESAAKAVALITSGVMMLGHVAYHYGVNGIVLPVAARVIPLVPKSVQERAQTIAQSKSVQKTVTAVKSSLRAYTNLQL